MSKKIFTIFIVLIVCMSIAIPVLAFDTGAYSPQIGSTNSKIPEIGNVVVRAIKIVGSITSVIALIIIGIKYIYGSMEQKAQYKETIMPYIIGAILVFGASQIVDILYEVAF